jgi:UDP-N-acetylmuramoylalanine--D-glutamate ligase
VIEQTNELDYLILKIDCFQLEITDFLRPSFAVLTSLAPDHLDRYGSVEAYVRANARLFRNQQALDWAIVQSEALDRLRELDLPVPAKTITFSADDRDADLSLDRGQIVSRVPNWSGPLLDLEHCQLRGPHNAENLMAALAVGHVLRLPVESMWTRWKTYNCRAASFLSQWQRLTAFNSSMIPRRPTWMPCARRSARRGWDRMGKPTSG